MDVFDVVQFNKLNVSIIELSVSSKKTSPALSILRSEFTKYIISVKSGGMDNLIFDWFSSYFLLSSFTIVFTMTVLIGRLLTLRLVDLFPMGWQIGSMSVCSLIANWSGSRTSRHPLTFLESPWSLTYQFNSEN